MTKEVRYIIENKRFQSSWDDYSIYGFFIFIVLAVIFGLELIFVYSTFSDILIGMSLILSSYFFGKWIIKRGKILNAFNEIPTGKGQTENFDLSNETIKALVDEQSLWTPLKFEIYRVKEIERDYWNHSINATLIYHSGQKGYLTVVCIDNMILINERPELSWLIILPLNGLNRFKTLLSDKSASH